MEFEKQEPRKESTQPVGALLKLLSAENEMALLELLEQEGASEVSALAPGFYSVVASPQALHAAESLAQVEIKHKKGMH